MTYLWISWKSEMVLGSTYSVLLEIKWSEKRTFEICQFYPRRRRGIYPLEFWNNKRTDWWQNQDSSFSLSLLNHRKHVRTWKLASRPKWKWPSAAVLQEVCHSLRRNWRIWRQTHWITGDHGIIFFSLRPDDNLPIDSYCAQTIRQKGKKKKKKK